MNLDAGEVSIILHFSITFGYLPCLITTGSCLWLAIFPALQLCCIPHIIQKGLHLYRRNFWKLLAQSNFNYNVMRNPNTQRVYHASPSNRFHFSFFKSMSTQARSDCTAPVLSICWAAWLQALLGRKSNVCITFGAVLSLTSCAWINRTPLSCLILLNLHIMLFMIDDVPQCACLLQSSWMRASRQTVWHSCTSEAYKYTLDYSTSLKHLFFFILQ